MISAGQTKTGIWREKPGPKKSTAMTFRDGSGRSTILWMLSSTSVPVQTPPSRTGISFRNSTWTIQKHCGSFAHSTKSHSSTLRVPPLTGWGNKVTKTATTWSTALSHSTLMVIPRMNLTNGPCSKRYSLHTGTG